MKIFAPSNLFSQQSPRFNICTLVIVYVFPNLAYHHAPSSSCIVWIQVNSPYPQLALKLIVLIGFQGFILSSFHIELIEIWSSLKAINSGMIVVPVLVKSGSGSGTSSAQSSRSMSKSYSHSPNSSQSPSISKSCQSSESENSNVYLTLCVPP